MDEAPLSFPHNNLHRPRDFSRLLSIAKISNKSMEDEDKKRKEVKLFLRKKIPTYAHCEYIHELLQVLKQRRGILKGRGWMEKKVVIINPSVESFKDFFFFFFAHSHEVFSEIALGI